MRTFKASLPLTATTFVNRVGNIGLSLLPVILVERSLSVTQSSLIMLVTKSAGLLSTFIGGFLSDRIAAKRILLLSFALSAIGLVGMAWAKAVVLLALGALIAQFGTSLYNSPARLLLTRLVDKKDYQEAMAWLRTATNAGLITSYGVGAIFSSLGTAALVLFDAFTSIAAFFCGAKWLPQLPLVISSDVPKSSATTSSPLNSWTPYAICTFLVVGSTLIYEMFITGAAAKYRLVFGQDGIRVFSVGMVINTVLCTIFAVFAARMFKNARLTLSLGLLFQSLGSAIALFHVEKVWVVYLGMFVLTIGEVMFTSLSQVVLMHSIPQHKAPGSVYGIALTLQVGGRMIGGALAFPLVVYGTHPALVVLALAIPFIVVSIVGGKHLVEI